MLFSPRLIAFSLASGLILTGCGDHSSHGGNYAMACSDTAQPNNAHDNESPIVIANAWARSAASGQSVSAAYMRICNRGSKPLTLISANSNAAESVELHETTQNAEGVMRMAPITTLEIKAGGAVALKPGGAHLMLINLTDPLTQGASVDIRLSFDDGSTLNVTAPITDDAGKTDGHHGHH